MIDDVTALATIQEHSVAGRHQDCLKACQNALQANPEETYAYKYAGKSLIALGQFEKAQQCLLKAHQLDGSDPETIKDIGNVFNALQNDAEAIRLYKSALAIDPKYAPAINNLGLIAKRQGDFDSAEHLVKKAKDLDQSFAPYHMNLGAIYKELGQLDQALASTLKSLELKPDYPDALVNLGWIFQAMGNMEESTKSLQKALSISPQLPEALYLSSVSLKGVDSANFLLNKIEKVDQNTLNLSDSTKIQFAKANCFHQQKDYKNASDFLEKANEQKLLCMPSNASVLIKNIQVSANMLSFKEVSDCEQRCDQIFIVGVPRSGSTLLSAILNANPFAKDLGESRALPNAINAYSSQGKISEWRSLRDFYFDCIDEIIPPGSITVDKQLYNFIHCHYIANFMPSAKIIHATRNPLDNILSMLRANLMAGNNFTASIQDSAMVIIEQQRLMRIFNKRFPRKIYNCCYDKLVNEPKIETQKLYAWLGFDWSESCLDFHKNNQIINTASVMQVRQAISNKSVGGWRNYSLLLEPARKILLESNLFSAESLGQ